MTHDATSIAAAEEGGLVRETQTLMLRRVRVAMALAAGILVAFLVLDGWRVAPERFPLAVLLRCAGVAALLILFVASRLPGGVRRAEWIGLTAVLLTMTVTAAMMPLFAGVTDPQYAIQGTGMVLCILGSAVVLPIDGFKMLVLGGAGLLLHAAFTLDFPIAGNLPSLAATAASVLVAAIAARELTRSRLAEFRGRQAQMELVRARSDFAATLTHDIKNPLSVISGYVEILRDDLDMPPQERAVVLERIQRSVATALGLTANFLDVSKIDADRVELHVATADAAALLRATLSELSPNAERRNIRVVDASEPDLPPIEVDPAAISRVLSNVFGNAIKFTPEAGTIRARACRQGAREVAFVIEDTGSGIPPGREEQIFERYRTASDRPDSTGLGLFIAKTLTEAHGGRIVAENRRDGPGARFSVILPVAAAPS